MSSKRKGLLDVFLFVTLILFSSLALVVCFSWYPFMMLLCGLLLVMCWLLLFLLVFIVLWLSFFWLCWNTSGSSLFLLCHCLHFVISFNLFFGMQELLASSVLLRFSL